MYLRRNYFKWQPCRSYCQEKFSQVWMLMILCFNSFKIIFVCFFHLFLSLFIYWIFILIYNYCENQCLAFKDHTKYIVRCDQCFFFSQGIFTSSYGMFIKRRKVYLFSKGKVIYASLKMECPFIFLLPIHLVSISFFVTWVKLLCI